MQHLLRIDNSPVHVILPRGLQLHSLSHPLKLYDFFQLHSDVVSIYTENLGHDLIQYLYS